MQPVSVTSRKTPVSLPVVTVGGFVALVTGHRITHCWNPVVGFLQQHPIVSPEKILILLGPLLPEEHERHPEIQKTVLS